MKVVEEFLAEVEKQLFSVSNEAGKSMIKELKAHIFDKAEDLAKERNIELNEEIFKEVIEKLGSPKEIADDYKKLCPVKLEKQKRTNTIIQLIIGISSAILGLIILYYVVSVERHGIYYEFNKITFFGLLSFSVLLIFGVPLFFLSKTQLKYPAKYKELRTITFVFSVVAILLFAGIFGAIVLNKLHLTEKEENPEVIQTMFIAFNNDSEGNVHVFYLDNRNYNGNYKFDLFYKKLNGDGNVIKDKLILKNFYYSKSYYDKSRGIVRFDENKIAFLHYLALSSSIGKSYYLRISENSFEKFNINIGSSNNFDFSVDNQNNLYIAIQESYKRIYYAKFDAKGNLLNEFNITYSYTEFNITYFYNLSYYYFEKLLSIKFDYESDLYIFSYVYNNFNYTISKINYKKISKDGNILNKTIINFKTNASSITFLEQTFYNNFIILFWEERNISYNFTKFGFMKIDNNGTILFDKNITEIIYGVKIVAKENIYLVYSDYYNDSNKQITIMKFDANGNLIFKKDTKIGPPEVLYIVIDYKENLHFALYYQKSFVPIVKYVKYDNNGNKVQSMQFLYKPKEKIDWNKYLYNVILLDIIIIAIILIIIRFRIYKVKFIKIKYK